jgi:hypothetical protein
LRQCSLFNDDYRFDSHGCSRIDNVRDLAARPLNDRRSPPDRTYGAVGFFLPRAALAGAWTQNRENNPMQSRMGHKRGEVKTTLAPTRVNAIMQ